MYIDVLIRIKNAQLAEKKFLKIRYTKMDYAVLELLKKFHFLKGLEIKGRLPKRIIEIELNGEYPIQGVRFLSRPSRRLYAPYKKLKPIKGGHGITVISSPKGIISDKEARKGKVGGQLLFEVW